MDIVPAAAEGEEEAPASDLVVSAEQVHARLWQVACWCQNLYTTCLRAMRGAPTIAAVCTPNRNECAWGVLSLWHDILPETLS